MSDPKRLLMEMQAEAHAKDRKELKELYQLNYGKGAHADVEWYNLEQQQDRWLEIVADTIHADKLPFGPENLNFDELDAADTRALLGLALMEPTIQETITNIPDNAKIQKAYRLLLDAHIVGQPRASFYLGILALQGKANVSGDSKRRFAIAVWTKGAREFHDVDCIENLGGLYFGSEPPEYRKAAYWMHFGAQVFGREPKGIEFDMRLGEIQTIDPLAVVPYGCWTINSHKWIYGAKTGLIAQMKTFLLMQYRARTRGEGIELPVELQHMILGYICTRIDYDYGGIVIEYKGKITAL